MESVVGHRVSSCLGPGNYIITLVCHREGSYIDGEIVSPTGGKGTIGPHPIDICCSEWAMSGVIDILQSETFTKDIENLELYKIAVNAFRFELASRRGLPNYSDKGAAND